MTEMPKRQLVSKDKCTDKIDVADPDEENFRISNIGLKGDWFELNNMGHKSEQSVEDEGSISNLGSSMNHDSEDSWSEASLEEEDNPFDTLNGDVLLEKRGSNTPG